MPSRGGFMKRAALTLGLIGSLAFLVGQVSPRPDTWLPASKVRIAGQAVDNLQQALDAGILGSGRIDQDGNGLLEFSPIFDADNDGSAYTTCTAKDAPFPQCKVTGQVVYPDTADDINVMIRDHMEPNGTIFLRGGWHVIFPCWDINGYIASSPGVSDPDDSTTRDSSSDASFGDCPDSKDGLPQFAIGLGGWKGTIQGVGASYRRMDTSTATAADFNSSTWIAIDMGRQIDSWYNVANARPIVMGYANDIANAYMSGLASYLGDGGGGYGRVQVASSPQDIRDLPDNTNNELSLCVCASEGGANCTGGTSAVEASALGGPSFDIQSATTKTQFILEGQFSDLNTKYSVALLRPRVAGSYSQGDCATSQEVEVDLAISEVNIESPTYPSVVTLGPWKQLVADTAWLSIVRDDYFDSAAQFRDLSFISNDWVGEAGGDCGHTPGLLPYNFTLTDDDCDSVHHVGIAGFQTRTALTNVGFLYGHGFQVDGDVFIPWSVPIWDGAIFRYGNGRAVSDPGFGWKMNNTRILDYFTEGALLDEYGLYRQVENLEVDRSRFAYIANLNGQWWDSWKDIRIRTSIFNTGFSFQCGTKFNRIENLHASGRIEDSSAAGTYGLVHFGCDPGASVESNEIIEGNTLIGLMEDPPGAARFVTGGEPGNGGGQVLVSIWINDDADHSVMGYNSLLRSQCLNDRVPTSFGGAPNTTEECVLLAVIDGDDADATISNEVDMLNRWLLMGNMVRGSLYGQWGYEGFYATVPDPSTASDAAVNRLFARVRHNARMNNTVIDDALAVFPVTDDDAVVMIASDGLSCDDACAVGGMVCDTTNVEATNVTLSGSDELASTTCAASASTEDFRLCPCVRSTPP